MINVHVISMTEKGSQWFILLQTGKKIKELKIKLYVSNDF